MKRLFSKALLRLALAQGGCQRHARDLRVQALGAVSQGIIAKRTHFRVRHRWSSGGPAEEEMVNSALLNGIVLALRIGLFSYEFKVFTIGQTA
jgi:hypothetical protein